ncbi:MAG: hypothetical protein ACREDR_05605 [Blastocatellia bacterium]
MKDRITKTLKGFNWLQWLVLFAFALVVGLTGVEIYRAVTATHHFRHHRDEPIRGWMTVPLVAHSYHIPPHVLYQALGVPPPPTHPDKRPLRMIAREQNRSMEQVRQILEDAIRRAQAAGETVPDHPPRGEPRQSPSRTNERRAPAESSSPRPFERGTP